MAKSLFVCFLALSTLAPAVITNGKDDNLDPGPINWWAETWTARPIEVSKSNAESTGVKLTFKFRASTTVSSACVQVYFPSGLTAPSDGISTSSENKYQSCGISVTSNKDASFEVKNVTLPSTSQAFGPFKLVIRQFSGSQIINISQGFGSIFVTSKIQQAATLGIQTLTGASADIYAANVGLYFTFNVNVDLWAHDTFVIYVDDRWTVGASPVCTTVNPQQGVNNYFFTADGSTALDCVAHRSTTDDPQQLVYVYGMGNDMDMSELDQEDAGLDFKLRISGFTAPVADWGATAYTWEVELWRWGTRHSVRKYRGHGPETNPGVITINSWDPNSSVKTNDIVQGVTLFMNAAFTLENLVPSGGKIVVEFDNVDVYNTIWQKSAVTENAADSASNAHKFYCYVKYNEISNSCSVTEDQKFTITLAAEAAAETQFVITTYTQFTNTSPQFKVTSYYSDGVTVIDTSVDWIINYVNSKYKKAAQFYIYFPAAGNEVVSDRDSYLKIGEIIVKIKGDTYQTQTSDLLNVYLPLTTTAIAQKAFYISSTGHATYPFEFNFDRRQCTAAGASGTPQNIPNEQGTVNTANQYITTSATAQAITILDGTDECGQFTFYNTDATPNLVSVYRPMIAANKETRYEAWIEYTVDSITYFNIAPITLPTVDVANDTVTCKRFCPYVVSFLFQVPYNVPTVANTNTVSYYLDIYFSSPTDSYLGSSLSYGDAYPYVLADGSGFSSTGLTFTLQKGIEGTGTALRMTGQVGYASASTYSLYTGLETATGTWSIKIYYVDTSVDPNMQYYFIDSSTDTGAHAQEAIGVTDTFNLTGSVNVSYAVAATALTITTESKDISVGGVDYEKTITVQLPRGFTFASSAVSLAGTTVSITTIKYLQSTNPAFAFPAIIAENTDAKVLTGAGIISASGIIAAPYQIISTSDTFKIANGSVSGATANDPKCFTANQNIVMTLGAITNLTYTPADIVGRGPTSYHTNMSVAFTVPTGIPSGGRIHILVDSNWEILGQCSAEGLPTINDTTAVVCERIGNKFIISSFGAVNASTGITVSWTNVMPPYNNGTVDVLRGHIDEITTYAVFSRKLYAIDSLQTVTNDSCTVRPRTLPGVSTVTETYTIPYNALEKATDIYIKFSLQHTLPTGSTISVSNPSGSWSTPDTMPEDYIFFSKKFSAARVEGGVIYLTTAEDITANTALELRIDNGVDNPSPTTISYVKFKTYYQGITFDEDKEETVTNGHKLDFEGPIEGDIDVESVQLSVVNADELSDYTFELASSEDFERGDELWIKLPREFDPFLNVAYQKFSWGTAGYYYIDCESEELGSQIRCLLDHWFVKVQNLSGTKEDTKIKLKLLQIRNPKAGTTGKFKLYHMDSEGKGKAKENELNGVTLQGFPDNVLVKRVISSNPQLNGKATYTIEFYLTEKITDDHSLHVKLPRQYNTKLFFNNDPIDCSLHFIDHSDVSTDLSEQLIMGIDSCIVENNTVMLNIPQDFEITFDTTNRVILRISGIQNPDWGFSRQKTNRFEWDFDANDESAFTVYDVWTNQVQVSVYDNKLMQYIDNSFLDVNAGYFGFGEKYSGFTINGFTPSSKSNQITLRPGTQTADITISTLSGINSRVSAKRIRFVPSINESTPDDDNLVFSSDDDFLIYYGEYETSFRIAASQNTFEGIYYIDWDVIEERQYSLTQDQYDNPPKTRLEVIAKDQVAFTIADIYPIVIGGKSLPIKVSTPNSPHTKVSVNISVYVDPDSEQESLVSVSPQTLDFYPGVNERYFQISVDEAYTFVENAAETLVFWISGVNMSAYSITGTKAVTITNVDSTESGSITLCSHSEPTMTSTTLQGSATVNGIFYYYVAASGSASLTGEELKSLVGDIFNFESQSVPDEVEEDEVEADYEPNAEELADPLVEPWVAYQRRLYGESLSKTWAGAVLVTSGATVNLETLTELYADTPYFTQCFLENQAGTLSEGLTDTWTTRSIIDAASISLAFEDDVSEDFGESIRNILANIMGVSPYKLINPIRVEARRRLQTTTTTFTWTNAPTLNQEVPTLLEEVILDSEQTADLKAALLELGIPVSPQITTTAIPLADFQAPTWTSTPSQSSVTSNSVSASLQCSLVGDVCGVCVTNSSGSITAQQILAGVGADNQVGYSQCINFTDVSESATLTVSGLSPSTSYTCYYACYSDFPVKGVPMSITETNNAASLSVTTPAAEVEAEDDDWSDTLFACLGLVLLVQVI